MNETNPARRLRNLRVDLYESKDAYLLVADLPGSSDDDISIELEGTTLRVEALTDAHRYARTMRIPHGVERATANYEAGVLHVNLLKSAEAKPRRIAITA